MMSFTEAPRAPAGRTQDPIVTGTSVLALKYKDGVMIMADCQMSYGSLARYKNIDRIRKVNDHTLVGAGGEYSDYQYILRLLDQLAVEDITTDDGSTTSPKELHSYLARVMYNRRTKVNPLWNSVLVAGFTPAAGTTTTAVPVVGAEGKAEEKKEEKKAAGTSFLGLVDLYGSNYTGDYLATGYGAHMGLPLLRKHWKPDMTFAEGKKLLEDCMTILIYRDCHALNKFTLGTVTSEGPKISAPYKLTTFWEHSRFINPGM